MSGVLTKPRAATVALELDTTHHERLKLLAATKKRSAHDLMTEAIERYLKVEDNRRAILQSVDAAIADHEAAGLHITHEEVKAWGRQLKTDRNAKLPECHP